MGPETSERGSRQTEIRNKLRRVKTLGVWLLMLLLSTTSAIPNAIAPSGTAKRDAARAAFNLPLRSSRRSSRALPFEENLSSISLQEKSAPRTSLGRVSDVRVSRFSAPVSDFSAAASHPLGHLCRLRI